MWPLDWGSCSTLRWRPTFLGGPPERIDSLPREQISPGRARSRKKCGRDRESRPARSRLDQTRRERNRAEWEEPGVREWLRGSVCERTPHPPRKRKPAAACAPERRLRNDRSGRKTASEPLQNVGDQGL